MANDIFLSYAKKDLSTAENLYRDLCSAGLSVWFDRQSLRPGEKWKTAISNAIRNSKYFLALLSRTSVDKRGYLQREIREALELLLEVPEHHVFIIPVRIDDCIPSNPELRDLQFVDLFPSYDGGFEKLRSFLMPASAPESIQAQNSGPPVTVSFNKRFGDGARQLLHGLARDPQGNILIVGDFWGSIDFGNLNLYSVGDRDIFLAKFDPNGNHLWSNRYGDELEQVGVDVATDGTGAVYIASAFNGSLEFGGGSLISAGRYNIALAKLDANGNHIWSKSFGDQNYHVPECIAVTPSGIVAIAGRFQGCLDFGGTQIQSKSEQTDIFIAIFSPDGGCMWAKRFGGRFEQQTQSLAMDANGNIALVGVFKGELNFDSQTLAQRRLTEYCGFIAELDGSGNVLWCRPFGETPAEVGSVVAFDGINGDVLAAGFVRNKLPHDLSQGTNSLCLLARYGQSGLLKWYKSFGTPALPASLSIAADGRLLLTGHFTGSIDFGQGSLVSAGGYDIFAAMFTPDGNVQWSKRFGDRWPQFLIRGVHGHDRSVVLAGSFHGTIDFGSGPVVATGYDGAKEGNEDVFLAILQA